MNARIRLSLALVVLVALGGCAPQGRQELPLDLLAAIEAFYAAVESGDGRVFRLRGRAVVDRDVSGDLAYLANSDEYTWHRQDAEPQWHRTKNVHIWKRDPDGKWKLHLDIWNSDVPLGDFAAERLPKEVEP